jgi:predicted regulator of Ras-like GTPase activity (Roadblock/LC7/MglB family)
MTFEELLARIVNQTPGALAGGIVGADGIAVEEYHALDADVDLASLAAEFQRLLDEARKVASGVYGRPDALRELVVLTDAHQLLFRQVDEDYALVIALAPSGLLGKARYLARGILAELRQEL